ncbi:hypothetical protein AJ80_05100 [Polytolypa hystricis UAMH7299]|uniref:Uncharacterized protein n=1 Tax=Polytolypa hystricis (strain UAMH7299) TaxID=1447883 RepID=A0A2B7Y6F0_POLH7|nr:hypothetical protein AJ80_05100 [Polytolypa hystricis UAMH7299]
MFPLYLSKDYVTKSLNILEQRWIDRDYARIKRSHCCVWCLDSMCSLAQVNSLQRDMERMRREVEDLRNQGDEGQRQVGNARVRPPLVGGDSGATGSSSSVSGGTRGDLAPDSKGAGERRDRYYPPFELFRQR